MSRRERPTECEGYYEKNDADRYMDALEAENRELRADATGFEAQAHWYRTRLAEAVELLREIDDIGHCDVASLLDRIRAFVARMEETDARRD